MNTKTTENENKIPIITGLVTTAAVNTKVTDVESKIPDITNLANKADINTKATEIENKRPNTSRFVTTPEFNKLKKVSFDEKMKEAEYSLANKTEVKNAIKFRK